MLIVTNTECFPAEFHIAGSKWGQSVIARSDAQFLAHRGPDVVWLVNCDPALAQRLALAGLFRPRPPIVSFDLVLRRPSTFASRVALPVKRFLLSRIEHHIHLFKCMKGYEELFGIQQTRSSFVPFKVNLNHGTPLRPVWEGTYVLCFGRSLRDYDTFFDAVEGLPYQAAIARPDARALRAHGARFSRPFESLPRNVAILEDDGSEDAQLRILRGAKIVVLPILKDSIAASGISTCLNAMALGKCVIGSDGPGMSDIFAEEIIAIPPEDSPALRNAIIRAWSDEELRSKTASAGYRYAQQAGGETEMFARIIDQVVKWADVAGYATT